MSLHPPPRSTLFPYTTLFRSGPTDAPRQYWTIGGMQLIATPGFTAPPSNDAGWLAHLGIMVEDLEEALAAARRWDVDRKSTRLNSSHGYISYAVFCLKKKNRT